MKKAAFTENWTCNGTSVIVPHDAMIHEKRTADAAGGSAHGYFPGGIYTYEKKFFIPAEWKEKYLAVEFEGVYKNAEVFLNGKKLYERPYGYVPFLVRLDENANYGEKNLLTVIADNSKLPNSRWYTGSGIYRPVNLYLSERTHISYQGVKITTLSCKPAKIRIEGKLEGIDSAKEYGVRMQIQDGETTIAEKFVKVNAAQSGNEKATAVAEIELPEARLWDEESPNLYLAKIILEEGEKILDTAEERFGIRKLSWSTKGFFVNGKATLLRGGCVHHDNGILGAASWEKSERRRVKIMKEAGFNAIRSSHNPASEAMLRACDELGMYVMDETFDTWYNRKNKYDYGCDFEAWWEADTTAMVERDYNHPSVILYSIGNEVAEPCEKKGLQVGSAMIECIHSHDHTRPVTCGTNLMVMGRAAKGQGIYQDGETNTTSSSKEQKKESNNSLAFNIMASFIGSGMNKGGNSKKVDAISSPFLDRLDIAGYNYGSGRYPLEGKAHPERIVFGSETFPQDIWKNWKMVKEYPYLIGDFMWTAWDYLGEAGIGAWSYTRGMPFNRPYPWLLGGAGVIDILGNPDASCRYAAVIWEKNSKPVIGVRPANHPGVRVSKSVWRGTNAIESWSWSGCEGNKTIVEVYGNGATVKLYLNNKLIGKKKLKQCKALFSVKYKSGSLCAIQYDAQEKEIGRSRLLSAEGEKRISVCPEEKQVKAGDIVYVDISVKGTNGIVESAADEQLNCRVKGGVLLGFGSADPCTTEAYDTGKFKTYYGRAQAVVYAPETGTIRVEAEGEHSRGEAVIEVV